MGRNLDNPFIPSDEGSLFGLGFFSNSFISIPFRVSPRALRQAEPIGGTSPHTRRQYRGPFSGVSRELPLNHRSHPSNSFEFSRSLPRRSPIALTLSNASRSGGVPLSYTRVRLPHCT